MENLEIENFFSSIYKNKVVLITGQNGFKGSWLSYWLTKMGAKVIGYSLEVSNSPNHSELLNLNLTTITGDIRDENKLNETFQKYKPDIVFHLAAQSLVRFSYKNPIDTYETNVIGTLKVLEMCKKYHTKVMLNITSDKVYENKEINRGYSENDTLGGYDPYSSSKSCTEILTNSYRNSYFNIATYKKEHNTLLASCRAGNVIGGGDWAEDRLIPDIMLSIYHKRNVEIRNPKAIRPWQYVLEPLSGYLLVGQKLLEEKINFSGAWNFGPPINNTINVQEVIHNIQKYWNTIEYTITPDSKGFHEASILQLDCSKAENELNWKNVYDYKTTFEKTVTWYKAYYEKNELLTDQFFNHYIKNAFKKGLIWTKN